MLLAFLAFCQDFNLQLHLKTQTYLMEYHYNLYREITKHQHLQAFEWGLSHQLGCHNTCKIPLGGGDTHICWTDRPT